MQITFNVPDALQRALDWLAAKQNASADALMYITAYQGFEKELRRKVSDAMRREEAEASGQNEHSSDPCDGCPVGGGCIYTACGSGGRAAG